MSFDSSGFHIGNLPLRLMRPLQFVIHQIVDLKLIPSVYTTSYYDPKNRNKLVTANEWVQVNLDELKQYAYGSSLNFRTKLKLKNFKRTNEEIVTLPQSVLGGIGVELIFVCKKDLALLERINSESSNSSIKSPIGAKPRNIEAVVEAANSYIFGLRLDESIKLKRGKSWNLKALAERLSHSDNTELWTSSGIGDIDTSTVHKILKSNRRRIGI